MTKNGNEDSAELWFSLLDFIINKRLNSCSSFSQAEKAQIHSAEQSCPNVLVSPAALLVSMCQPKDRTQLLFKSYINQLNSKVKGREAERWELLEGFNATETSTNWVTGKESTAMETPLSPWQPRCWHSYYYLIWANRHDKKVACSIVCRVNNKIPSKRG